MLGFIFDTKMLKNSNDYYAINLNYNLWESRYLPIFKKMIVSTRVVEASMEKINSNKGYVKSNGKNVTMMPITSYNKITDLIFRRRQIKQQLSEVIDLCNKIIIRLPSPLGSYACKLCKKKNKSYAIEMVACPWDGYTHHGHWAGKLIAPIMYFITKKNCKEAKRVLYVTRNFLQSRYPTKGETTNASNVMINKPDDKVLENRINKIKNKNKKDFVLGLVGPLNLKSKGHIIALKAIKLLRAKYPDIKIQFLGLGDVTSLSNEANNLGIIENVEFIGTLPGGSPVLNWMDTLDLLVIPSFQEGLPRVLIEAMSRACPAVGSRTGGIPELIRNSCISIAGDYKGLANDIDSILSNKELQIELAKENFNNSIEYSKEILDERRSNFWNQFHNENH